MPYISVTLSQEPGEGKKEVVKSELGKLISIIPGKSENGLMVCLNCGCDMYMRGVKADAVFVDIRLFREAPLEAKQKLAAAILEMLSVELQVKKQDIYLVFGEYLNWGLNGALA